MIDVDEDGVEAAGATGVSVTLFSFFESERDVRINRWGRKKSIMVKFDTY